MSMNQDELLARLQGFEWNDFECKKAQHGVPEDAHKTVSDFASKAELLEPVSDTRFQASEKLRPRFAMAAERVIPQVTPQVTPQVGLLLANASGEMTRRELMDAVRLKDREHLADTYPQLALAVELLAMANPDMPQCSRQRYRLTERGLALTAEKITRILKHDSR